MELQRFFIAIKWVFTLITTLAYLALTAFLMGNDRYMLKFENSILQIIPGNIMIWVFLTLLLFVFLQLWSFIESDLIKAFGNIILTTAIYGVIQTYIQQANDSAIVFKTKIFTIWQIFTLDEKLEWKPRVVLELKYLGYPEENISFDIIDWKAINSYNELLTAVKHYANLKLQRPQMNTGMWLSNLGGFIQNHPFLIGTLCTIVIFLGWRSYNNGFVSDISGLFSYIGKSVGNVLGISKDINTGAEMTNNILKSLIQQVKQLNIENNDMKKALELLTSGLNATMLDIKTLNELIELMSADNLKLHGVANETIEVIKKQIAELLKRK